MRQQHLIDIACIWFEHTIGHRNAKQKAKCETLSWYYLMQAEMKELHP
jgi:hypothetical protein